MTARPILDAVRGHSPAGVACLACLLATAGTAAQAAGGAGAVPGSRSVDTCPAIRVPAGGGDLNTLLQKVAEAAGFTLHYGAPARQVSSFEGRFSTAEFVSRLGREAGLVVQYRRLPGCPEDASIARLWVLPTRYPAMAAAVAAAPAAASAQTEEAEARRRKEAEAQRHKLEDAENAIYVNQN